ncbi:tRNA pseudouridine(38-40) synthase TruA [Nonlabens xiamenensis]|uniref:tRNA pseudouridine(38-40) synthase TruA n=1 Tax=Nonlabens xiamenensis TaxID=2341043 RepID=UPI000F606973|nr:tRNA pseudouridine(38-40) synthase TruA [Nonlabens xiamenensis]
MLEAPRYFVEFAYNGAAYHGWQRQPHCITVQEVLEEGFCKILRESIILVGAGRTDAGVHARMMVAHFITDQSLDLEQTAYRINRWLPKDIAVYQILPVAPKAHARFHALSRSYEYHFHLRPDPFHNHTSYILYREPNFELMDKAAQLLLKHKDFQCFSRSNTDVKTYLCDISEARFVLEGHHVVFHITANRFLRNMVRAVVGTLLEIGYGKLDLADLERIIASKNRSEAGASAPAQGLYLTQVEYPKDIYL